MLDLSNLKVDIEGSPILNGISLSVAAGELVCLVGRNGAGKTTTFRSIMGYRRAQSGSISFDGIDLTKLPTWQIAQRGIGFSPEELEVYADLDRGREYRTVDLDPALGPTGRRSHRGSLFRVSEAAAVSGARRRAIVGRRAQDGVDRPRPDARSETVAAR